MTIQMSATLRNAMMNAIETTVGTSPILRLRTGAPPANVATADSGSVLAEMTLPSDWLTAASSGSVSKSGTWQDSSANADGTVGHFRIYTSGGTAVLQGTVTATGGGGDATMDNPVLATGQNVTAATFTLTMGNA